MGKPNYTNDEVYQEVVLLCEAAGLRVEYRPLADNIYSHTDRYTIIEMPDADIFDSSEHAAKVLGHELAHCVFERSRGTSENTHNEEECDKFGERLYTYAEMVAGHKAEAIWQE